MCVMSSPEAPRRLRIFSFALHVARGLVRARATRRRAMFFVTLGAMLMVFAGMTFLQERLSPHDHPIGFLLYWIVCGWVTFTALLLAVFDVLMVRLEARTESQRLRRGLEEE